MSNHSMSELRETYNAETGETEMGFFGFDVPKQNWSRLPHELIAALPMIDSLAELKIILYVLRHTWGFNDDDKKITIDEFQNGRKRRNKETGEMERMDNGIGMSEPSIRSGIESAIEDGFLDVMVDDRDKARIRKYYALKMSGDEKYSSGIRANQRERSLPPEGKKFTPRGKDSLPRTEKETLERNQKKYNSSPSDECDFDSIPSASGKEVQKQEEPARMTADEYKTRVRAAMSKSGNKKRVVAEGKSAVDEDEVQVARILASVKDQQVLPSDLFRDKKNATAIIYRRAAKALIHEMKAMGRTLDDVKKTGDYFLNGGGERYRAPNVNYAAGTIAAHFAEHWRAETKKPIAVPAPVQKLKVPDYAR